MKKFKHLITYTCDKKCLYCINNYLSTKGGNPIADDILDAYLEMFNIGYKHVIITGGEPTLCKELEHICAIARDIFFKVTLHTANEVALTKKHYNVNDMMFSIHDPYLPALLAAKQAVNTNVPVWASMIAEHYREQTIPLLIRAGFSGLTVREKYPDGGKLMYPLPMLANFSTRYMRVDNCNSGTLLLPDLTRYYGEELTK